MSQHYEQIPWFPVYFYTFFKCFKSLPFVNFQTAKDSYDQNDYRSLSIRVYFLNHFCFAYNIDPYVFIRALSLIEVLIRVLLHRSIDQSPHSCRLNDQSPTSYRNISVLPLVQVLLRVLLPIEVLISLTS